MVLDPLIQDHSSHGVGKHIPPVESETTLESGTLLQLLLGPCSKTIQQVLTRAVKNEEPGSSDVIGPQK